MNYQDHHPARTRQFTAIHRVDLWKKKKVDSLAILTLPRIMQQIQFQQLSKCLRDPLDFALFLVCRQAKPYNNSICQLWISLFCKHCPTIWIEQRSIPYKEKRAAQWVTKVKEICELHKTCSIFLLLPHSLTVTWPNNCAKIAHTILLESLHCLAWSNVVELNFLTISRGQDINRRAQEVQTSQFVRSILLFCTHRLDIIEFRCPKKKRLQCSSTIAICCIHSRQQQHSKTVLIVFALFSRLYSPNIAFPLSVLTSGWLFGIMEWNYKHSIGYPRECSQRKHILLRKKRWWVDFSTTKQKCENREKEKKTAEPLTGERERDTTVP